MTTTKHPITKDADGNGFTYRGTHVRINRAHPDRNERYAFSKGWSYVKSSTRAGILLLLDQHIAEQARLHRPVRRGPIYCAPFCGCKCTYEGYLAAKQRAADLCALLGPGWTPDVWENGGWNAAANNGVARMHTPKREGETFGLYFNTEKQVVVHGDDPRELVRTAAKVARDMAANILAAAETIAPAARATKAANDGAPTRRRTKAAA